MANSLKYIWNVSCVTEGGIVQIEQKHKPSVCPNNPGHTIDLNNTIYNVDLKPDSGLINPESMGYYVSQGINFLSAPSTVTEYTYTFPYDVFIINARLYCEDINKGDNLSIYGSPDLQIGILTQNCVIGDTEVYVNSTAIEYTVKANYYNFGVDTTKYYIKSVDLINSKIILTIPLTSDFTAGTSIKRTVIIVNDILLPSKHVIQIGTNLMNRLIFPAGFQFLFIYTNNTAESKTVNLTLECF